MLGFVFRLIPPRPTFAFDMDDDERDTMQQHAGYWYGLVEDGTAVAFGPVDDPSGSWGLGLVLAEDMAAAEAVRDADPAVQSPHGLDIEISPMFALVTPDGTYAPDEVDLGECDPAASDARAEAGPAAVPGRG